MHKPIMVMTALMKTDIWEILKVNMISWPVVVWAQNSIDLKINEVIQQTSTTILVVVTLIYTVLKLINLTRDMRWERRERRRIKREREKKRQQERLNRKKDN